MKMLKITVIFIIRPINLNLLGLLGNKIARIIALKRGLLGGVISLIPFQQPRPGGVKPCYKTCYEPSPPVVPVTTPPPIVTSTPHPSYLAPGHYNPPTTTTRYHTNVGSVIKVVDDGDDNSGARFPSGSFILPQLHSLCRDENFLSLINSILCNV